MGNIGGQLGLFLGFSFAGFIAWLLDLAPKLLNLIKRHLISLIQSTRGYLLDYIFNPFSSGYNLEIYIERK